MKKIFLLGLLLLLMMVTAAWVYAASIRIDWEVMAGGGGRSTAAHVTLDDTIGQPVVGVAQNGDVVIESGFWSGTVATSSPPPTATPKPKLFLPIFMRRS